MSLERTCRPLTKKIWLPRVPRVAAGRVTKPVTESLSQLPSTGVISCAVWRPMTA